MVLRWVRCAIVMVALSAIAPIGRAATLAYDGFDYSTSSGLNGNTGGVGFGSNGWTQSGTQPNPALATTPSNISHAIELR